MSIASVQRDKITIIYKVLGSVTKSFTKLNKDDHIEVLGPLGNTFELTLKGYTPVLIGGGTGLAPILNIAEYFKNINQETLIILGAKTAEEHFIEHDPDRKVFLSTDNGSVGIEGTVIDAFKIVLDGLMKPYIYACGPEPMLKALKKYLNNKNIFGQFSVESYMACGFGFCQGCAISNEEKDEYHLVCKDGPVFKYDEVSFG
jgi:dihydroorotate dehydrogenase electron transfer subunit